MVLNKDRTVENDSLMNEALYEYNYTLRYNKWPLRKRIIREKRYNKRARVLLGSLFLLFLSIFGKKNVLF